jgi:hypothetical protein
MWKRRYADDIAVGAGYADGSPLWPMALHYGRRHTPDTVRRSLQCSGLCRQCYVCQWRPLTYVKLCRCRVVANVPPRLAIGIDDIRQRLLFFDGFVGSLGI